ncbi:unnamed protein product [Echinostoma caproni]|uniref:Methyltransferase n=1 Tax=Echinostoma caproni TaxID=27848 RepID=A0A183B182_9TREM|nr:unnamed protein product [Echinostoma caproni]
MLHFVDRFNDVLLADATHRLNCGGYVLWHAMLEDDTGLGCRSAFKAELQSTPAELTFRRTLRLPGEMVVPTPPPAFNYGDYAARLVHRIQQLHIQPPRQQTPLAYLP